MIKMTAQHENSSSYFNQEISNSTDDTDESSDFVVLGCPPSYNSHVENSTGQFNDLQISAASLQADSPTDEVQHWISEILKENKDLKESLEKTNLKAKQQFQTLQMCEEQFTARCKKYEAIIEGTHKYKLKLQQENEGLKTNVEELKTALAIAVNDEKCTKCKAKIDEMSLEIKELKDGKAEYEKEIEKYQTIKSDLQQKVTEFQLNIEKLEKKAQNLETEKKALLVMNTELENKVLNMEKEKSSLQINAEEYSLIQNMGSSSETIKSSESILNSGLEGSTTIERSKNMSSSSLVMHEHQARVSELNQLLAEQQLEVSKLQLLLEQKDNEIKKLKPLQLLPSLECQQMSLANELKVSEEKFQLVALSAQKYKERCDSLQQWLKVYQEKLESVRLTDTAVIEQLQIEITTLRHMLAEEQAAKLEDKKNLEEARQQFENLLTEYKKDELEAWKQIESKHHQEELDKVTAVVVEKNEDISRLNEEIADLKIKAENFPILEAQVQLYKQDFEEESKAKVNALKEIDCLKADLQIMYTAKEKLSEELAKVSKSGRHQRRAERRAVQEEASNENPEPFSCPKCNLVFKDFQALCNHVDICISDNPFDYP